MLAPTTSEDVLGFAGQQVDAMRAASYHDTDTIDSELTVLNKTSALLRADLARKRADGSEIGRFEVTYLITAGADGLRISVLVLHA